MCRLADNSVGFRFRFFDFSLSTLNWTSEFLICEPYIPIHQLIVFPSQPSHALSQLGWMSYLRAYAVAFVSMLGGAAFVHNIYKPDLVSLQSMNLQPAREHTAIVPCMPTVASLCRPSLSMPLLTTQQSRPSRLSQQSRRGGSIHPQVTCPSKEWIHPTSQQPLLNVPLSDVA